MRSRFQVLVRGCLADVTLEGVVDLDDLIEVRAAAY